MIFLLDYERMENVKIREIWIVSYYNGATFSTLLYCSDLNELVTYSTSPGRLHLSDRAHIVFDFHQAIDGLNEAKLGDAKLGETDR